MWKVQTTFENSKASSSDPEEECELKWRRWKNFLHGIIFHLKHGKHSDLLNESEKQVVEDWSKCFSIIEPGNLRQLSATSETELIPITSYLECFKRISECHVHPGPSGRVEHLDFHGTLRAALDGCIWPMAEDDVHEYLKLCFQCRLTTEKSHLLPICDTSYKADLPTCFLGPPRSSELFCGDEKQMPPSKVMPSCDQSTHGADASIDPVPRKGRKLKSSAPPQQPAKGNPATKSLQKTLAKAKKTLIKATTEQGKKRRTKKTEPEGTLKTPVDHTNGFEPNMDDIPALTPSTSGMNKDGLEKDPVMNMDLEKTNGKSNSRKRALPEEFEADGPSKRPNLGEPNMDSSLSKGVTDEALMKGPPIKGLNLEMRVEESSKTACAGCGFKATSQSQLSDHWRLGSSTKKRHKCCLCSFTCKSFEKFSNHVEKVHSLPKHSPDSEKAPLVCPFCPYVVAAKEREKYDEHIKKCKEAFEVESSTKSKSIDKDISMSHKVKEVSHTQGDPIQEHPTDQLQEVAQTAPLGIPAHATVPQEGHLPSNAFPQIYNHLCEICCTLWDSPASLEYHLSKLHKVHFAHLPFKVLSRSDPLGASPKPFFPCMTCGDRFWSVKGLALHEEFVHGCPSEKRPFASGYHSSWRKTELPDITTYMARHHITIADMLLSKFCALCTEKLSCPRSFENHMLTLHRSAFPNRQTLYVTLFSQISKGECLPSDLSSSIETLKCHTPSSSFITLLLKCIAREEGQKDYPKLCHGVGNKEHERRNVCPQGHQCPYCECQFTSQDIMLHINQYHQVRCTNCKESFSSRNAHSEHVQLFHCDIEEESDSSTSLGDVKIVMSTFETVEGRLKVGPSDWKPSSSRPHRKIPLYVEDSTGIWQPQPQEDTVETGPSGTRFPFGILGC